MKKLHPLFLSALATTVGIVLLYGIWLLLTGPQSAILRPEGLIGEKQRDLIVFATGLMLIVVIPVFILTGFIVFKYREDKKGTYRPKWDHHRGLELLWWGFPFAIIVILSVVTWYSSHDLDPYKPLVSQTKPVKVQVIALEWKWLFIYPEEDIATVNYLKFPKNTPINFEITADAPMNSFWIPKLGGQVYAMNGMTTKLHLMANQTGVYEGSSANLSGEGFAGMRFKAHSVSQDTYRQWLETTTQSSKELSYKSYQELAQPSSDVPPAFYYVSDNELYNKVIMKYMQPQDNSHGTAHTREVH